MGFERERPPVAGRASAKREKIRSRRLAPRDRAACDYIFEWAFQIPPPQPKNPECVSVQDFLLITSSLFTNSAGTRLPTDTASKELTIANIFLNCIEKY